MQRPVKPYFHVGVVVPNLERAMEELGTVLGATWTEIAERPLGEWTVRVAFATDGPPFIELVEGPPGSPWEAAGGARLHHLAWWIDDLARERERLASSGFAPEFDGRSIGALFDYYAAPESGLRIELVDGSIRKGFYERWGLDDPDDAT
jgi:Glyoxalase/Bleomycin resistance protein/Dioxygenase superfamily